MSSMLFSKYTTKFFSVALCALALSGCGGGGGGGGGSSSTANSNGSTPNLLAGFPNIPALAINDISSATPVVMSRHSSREIADALLFFLRTSDSLYRGWRNSNYAGATNTNKIETKITTCASGKSTDTYQLAPNGTLHSVQNYESCEDVGGYIKNGFQVSDVSRTDSNGFPLDFSLTFSKYIAKEVASGISIQYEGSIQVITSPQGLVTLTQNLEITQLNNNQHIQAKNLQIIFDSKNYSASPLFSSTATGIIYSSVVGEASLSTSPESFSHKFILAGANDGTVTVDDYQGTDNLSLFLDTNGDGQTDAYAFGVPADQLLATHTVNHLPTINVPSSYDPSRSTLLSVYWQGSNDPDYDYLSYQWSVVSAPAGATYQLDVHDYTLPTFIADLPGDYLLRLIVTDDGGPISHDILVHVKPLAPVITAPSLSSINSASSINLLLKPAIDIDGPYTYTVISAPTGLSVNSNGSLSWTAGPNPALSQTIYDAVVRISNSDYHTDAHVPIQVIDSNKADPIAKIDNGFSGQIIAAGNFGVGTGNGLLLLKGSQLYTAKWNGSAYVQDWVQAYDPSSGTGITAVATANLDNDPQLEIVEVSGKTGLVVVLKNGKEVRRTYASFKDTSAMAGLGSAAVRIADIDNDGHQEIVAIFDYYDSSYASTVQKLAVFDAATLQEKWVSDTLLPGSSVGATITNESLVLANVDNDPALEIVTSSGYVIDGITHQIEWHRSEGFAKNIVGGKFYGDGKTEIAAYGAMPDIINIYRISQQQPVQSLAANTNAFCGLAKAIDLDHDGTDELLVQSCGNSTISAYSVPSAQLLWRKPLNRILFTGASSLITDVDGDGSVDLAWNYSQLAVVSLPDATTKWSSTNTANFNTPTFNGFYGGTDYQTNTSIHTAFFWGNAITNSAPTGSTQNIQFNYDGSNFQIDPIDGALNRNINYTDVAIGDYDLDGHSDIFLSQLFNNAFVGVDIVDHESGVLKRSYHGTDFTYQVGSLAVGDLNGDGQSDVIVSGDNILTLYDPSNANVIGLINCSARDIKIIDLNGDGKNEIVLLTGNTLRIYSNNGGTYQLTTSFIAPSSTTLSALLITDLNGDSIPEIIVVGDGTATTSTVYTLNNSGTQINQSTIDGTVTNLLPDNFDSPGNVLGSNGSQLGIVSFNPTTGNINWRSAALQGTINPKSMHYGQPAAGGAPRLLIGTTSTMYLVQ